MEAQAAGRIHPLKVCVTAAAVVNPGCALTDFNAEEATGSPRSDAVMETKLAFSIIGLLSGAQRLKRPLAGHVEPNSEP